MKVVNFVTNIKENAIEKISKASGLNMNAWGDELLSPILTSRFRKALIFAAELHEQQNRKLSTKEIEQGFQPTPYIGHLLAVAALLIDNGCSEDVVIAGLLHDAIEDIDRPSMKEDIKGLFGEEVASIVHECSDTDRRPKPAWRVRKENYIEHLKVASEKALQVSLADKVHNAQSILFDLQRHGLRVWDRFSASKEDVIWYYENLTTIIESRVPDNILTKELRRLVEEIKYFA